MDKKVVIAAVVLILAVSNASTTVTAENTIVIEGTIETPDGHPAADKQITLYEAGYFGFVEETVQTDSEGHFSARVSTDDPIDVVFHDENSTHRYPKNGVPDVSLVELNITSSDDVDIGTVQLPDAKEVSIDVTKENQGPVRDGGAETVLRLAHDPDSYFSLFQYGVSTEQYEDGKAVFGDTTGVELSRYTSITVNPETDAYDTESIDYNPDDDITEMFVELKRNESSDTTPYTPSKTPTPTPTDTPTPTETATPTPTATPSGEVEATRSAPESLAPGETAAVSVSVTNVTDTTVLEESFEPEVGNATITNVVVGGTSTSALIEASDSSGVLISVTQFSQGDTVALDYEMTVPEKMEDGDTVSISGTATIDDQNYSVGTHTIDIQSGLTGIVAEYDSDGDGTISITELGDASADYTKGEITLGQLADVAREFVKS